MWIKALTGIVKTSIYWRRATYKCSSVRSDSSTILSSS